MGSQGHQHVKPQSRFVSSKDSSNPTVTSSEDGSMFLCWHPEKSFPYEFTKPLPRRTSEITEGESIIKAQFTAEEKNRYRPDGPTQPELMKIFHTTRHAFDHKPGMRHRKKNPPKDRDGI